MKKPLGLYLSLHAVKGGENVMDDVGEVHARQVRLERGEYDYLMSINAS